MKGMTLRWLLTPHLHAASVWPFLASLAQVRLEAVPYDAREEEKSLV